MNSQENRECIYNCVIPAKAGIIAMDPRLRGDDNTRDTVR